jgi:hypothetical protein
MKPVKAYFQTLATVVEFDDGSQCVVSTSYDSLTGQVVRRENDTTTPEQRAAMAAAGEMRIVRTSPYTKHGEW